MIRKKNKRIPISFIVVACLVVIAVCVGILAFIMWNKDKYTPDYIPCCPPPKLRFIIEYVGYNDNNNSLFFVISNIGVLPITTNELNITIEEYNKANGSFIGVVVLNKNPICKNTTLNPLEDIICNINNVNLDFHNKYYRIIATYKGVTAHYTLRR